MKLMIDPGHGGSDPGAVGPGGARECDIALAVSMMTAGLFADSERHTASLTRWTDKFVELDDRCAIANNRDADVFVSIHCNAAEAASATGFEVFTSPGWTEADPIATAIWQDLRAAFPDMRGRLDSSDGDPDKEARFRVLVGTDMPAVLVELGFISNPEEEKRLADPAFQTFAAYSIGTTLREVLDG